MARHRREIRFFSLSFLDIMSCGFGAVVLLFLIIKHRGETALAAPTPVPAVDVTRELDLLDADIRAGENELDALRRSLSQAEAELADREASARALAAQAAATAGAPPAGDREKHSDRITRLQQEVKQLEAYKASLDQGPATGGRDVRAFQGDGNREYLTGMKIGGRRVLILLDASASMLDETIVNIVRRRNMDAAAQRRAPKWQQATATVDWLTARLPRGTSYQIYVFNTAVTAMVDGTEGRWLPADDTAQLDAAVKRVRDLLPSQGTNLGAAFAAAARLQPQPETIFLITDGLPTLGAGPPAGTTISGRDRARLFESSVRLLPRRVPVNVILLPLEGDPLAASAYWELAQASRGAFLAPSRDWP